MTLPVDNPGSSRSTKGRLAIGDLLADKHRPSAPDPAKAKPPRLSVKTHGRRSWRLVILGLAIVFVLGGGGTAGLCKLYLDCSSFDTFLVGGGNSVNVTSYLGNGGKHVSLPPDLGATVVARGFTYPTDLAFLPDGRLLVAEKSGLIDAIAKNGKTTQPFLDLRPEVNSALFRGIMDVTVDPDFATHPFVYVTYTSTGAGRTSNAPTVVRVGRFKVNRGSAVASSQRVILGTAGTTSCFSVPRKADCLPSEGDLNGGGVVFAPDGTLFISTGDGGGKEGLERGAFLAQSIDTLGGKVLHVDRDGKGLRGNPYWDGNPRSNRSRIWAIGARNPFRISLLPGHVASPVIGDVGWKSWDRLVIANRGANLGWPCYEARVRTMLYRATPFCIAFYRTHAMTPTPPWIALKHDTSGQAVAAGVSLAAATALPARYRSDYLYGDWVTSKISTVPLKTFAQPVKPTIFARSAGGPVSFAVGSDGALYYVAANLGEVRRIAAASSVK